MTGIIKVKLVVTTTGLGEYQVNSIQPGGRRDVDKVLLKDDDDDIDNVDQGFPINPADILSVTPVVIIT